MDGIFSPAQSTDKPSHFVLARRHRRQWRLFGEASWQSPRDSPSGLPSSSPSWPHTAGPLLSLSTLSRTFASYSHPRAELGTGFAIRSYGLGVGMGPEGCFICPQRRGGKRCMETTQRQGDNSKETSWRGLSRRGMPARSDTNWRGRDRHGPTEERERQSRRGKVKVKGANA